MRPRCKNLCEEQRRARVLGTSNAARAGQATHRGSMELLEVVTDGQVRTISLTGAQVTIGRGLDNDVVLTGDGRASRSHALLTSIDGVWKVSIAVRQMGPTSTAFA